MKKLRCFLLSNAIACFAAIAPAQQNLPNETGERFFPMLVRVLTDDQRRSLRQIMESQRDQIQPLEEKIRASRQAMLNEIAGGKFDESVTRQYAEQSAKTEAELTVIFAKAFSQMRPPLSARQIEQLKKLSNARFQPYQNDPAAAPESHMKLPPPLSRDTNDLPVVQ